MMKTLRKCVSGCLFVALILSAVMFVSCRKPLEKYSSEQSDDKKIEILESLLETGGKDELQEFCSNFVSAEMEDVKFFKSAFLKKGNCKSAVFIGNYVANMAQTWLKQEMKKNPGATKDELMEAVSTHAVSLDEKIELLSPELKIIATRDSKELVSLLKLNFNSLTETSGNLDMPGISFIFPMLGEYGFELILDSVTTEDEVTMASLMMPFFRGDAVIPTLKMCENPKSSKFQRNSASTLIMMFSKTDSQVLDKVVEAYKHGRYFKFQDQNSQGKLDINIIMKAFETAWANTIELSYKGESAVVRYIAKYHLDESDNPGPVIRLICAIDFKAASVYLAGLDLESLSNEDMDSLFLACHPSDNYGEGGKKKEDKDLLQKYVLFKKLFLLMPASQREKQIYSLFNYAPEHVADFIMNNFSILSSEEKTTAIFLCGGNETRYFPEGIRKAIFEKIRPSCTDEEKGNMDFVIKNNSK